MVGIYTIYILRHTWMVGMGILRHQIPCICFFWSIFTDRRWSTIRRLPASTQFQMKTSSRETIPKGHKWREKCPGDLEGVDFFWKNVWFVDNGCLGLGKMHSFFKKRLVSFFGMVNVPVYVNLRGCRVVLIFLLFNPVCFCSNDISWCSTANLTFFWISQNHYGGWTIYKVGRDETWSFFFDVHLYRNDHKLISGDFRTYVGVSPFLIIAITRIFTVHF